MNPVLCALATANPKRYATQAEICAFLEAHFPMQLAERQLYRDLLLEGPIRGRYISVDVDEEICSQDADRLNARFALHSRRIAAQAARTALDRAGLIPAQIEGLIVNTCTGYLCPGLSSYLLEELGLPAHAAVLDLMGMGCGGAIPNLETACRMIQSGARRTVLSIAVEICSATFFLGPDPDLIVSNSIFSDGAAAAVLRADSDGDAGDGFTKDETRDGGSLVSRRVEGVPPSERGQDARDTKGSGAAPPPPTRLARFLDFASVTLPRYREQLRYASQGGRLRNVLTRSVPVIGAKAVAQVVRRLLERHGLTMEAVDRWGVHPGGTQVLDAVQRQVGLSAEQLRFSYEVFRDYGNMSSPSVLFVLDRTLRAARPQPGETGLLLSFGAGFTAFGALVEFF
ncbi:MAG: 3-oxoacyl-ACP synthase [Planctomycetes bacterium]|jgi:alkylresorcinol/alkylpyrone synthase|nr:3-oxoacyl-ACP synthase [Planctomycetota bacterium]